MIPGYVVPGQVVVEASDQRFSPGIGIEVSGSNLVATLLGQIHVENCGKGSAKLHVQNAYQNPYLQQSSSRNNSRRSVSQLPQIGDSVYAQVLRLSVQQVVVSIIAVENRGNISSDSGIGLNPFGSVHLPSGLGGAELAEVGEGYGGVIRVQDIRATEREKVKIQDQFQPGDIIRANVLSLGDGQHYFLTTAKDDLGVLFSQNPHTGAQLVPVDWQHVLDPSTGQAEFRKCANPFEKP